MKIKSSTGATTAAALSLPQRQGGGGGLYNTLWLGHIILYYTIIIQVFIECRLTQNRTDRDTMSPCNQALFTLARSATPRKMHAPTRVNANI